MLIKGVKTPRQKKFFTDFFHLFTLFKRLFAPTTWNQMSKLFKFSESLGKSNVKRWSQIWKLFLIKGVKLQRNFLVCFSANFALLAGLFLGIDNTITIGQEMLCLLYAGFLKSHSPPWLKSSILAQMEATFGRLVSWSSDHIRSVKLGHFVFICFAACKCSSASFMGAILKEYLVLALLASKTGFECAETILPSQGFFHMLKQSYLTSRKY